MTGAVWESDRVFAVAFGVSLGIHLVLLVGSLLSFPWSRPLRPRVPLEVVYDDQPAEQEVRRLEQQLERAKRETLSTPSPTGPSRSAQIRIPERPVLATTDALPDVLSSRSGTVDLTNLSEASRGDPVLLSYFSAIREQIQRTANHKEWLTGEMRQGLVYISFVLSSTGSIREVWVVSERSLPSTTLQDLALRIVKSASPFPAFPPSIGEPNKTIIVPLEFLVGS